MGNTIIDVINPIDLKSREKQIKKLIKQLEEHKRKGDLDKSTYDKIITEVLPEYKLKADLRDYKDNMLKLNKDNDDGDNEVDRIFMPHKLQDYVRENKSPAYYLTQASRCFNDQSIYKWYEITSEDKYKAYMQTSYAYITNNDWTKIRELRYEGLTKNFHMSNLFDLNVPFKHMGNIIRKDKDVDMITSDFSYDNVFDKLKDTANNVITNTETLSILSHSCSLNNDPINIQSIVNTYADNKILDKMGYIPNLIKSLTVMADKIRRILYGFYEKTSTFDDIPDIALIGLKKYFSLIDINGTKFINCPFMNDLQKNISDILKKKMSKEDISKVLLSVIELMEKYKTKDDTKDKNNSYTDIFYNLLSTIKKANNEWYKTSINTTIDNTTSINDSIEYMKRELSNIYDDSGKLIYSQLILHYIDVIFNEETYKKLYKDDNGYTDTKNTTLGVAIGYLTTIGVLIHLLQKEPSNVSHLSSNMIENTIYNSLLKSSNPDDSNILVSYLLNEVLQSSNVIYTEDILFLSIVFDIKMTMITMFSNYIDEHDISENTITFTKPGTYLIKYDTIQFNLYSIVDYIFNYIDKNNIDSDYENWTKEYSELKKDKNLKKGISLNTLTSNSILSRDNIINKKFLINLMNKLNIKKGNLKYKNKYKEYFLKYIKIYSRDPYRYRYINEIFNKMIHKLINVEQKYNIDTNQYEYYVNIYTNYPHKPTEEELKDKSEEEKQNIINKYNRTITEKKSIFNLQKEIVLNSRIVKKYILVEYDGKTVTKIPDLNIIPDKNNMGRYNKAYFYDIFNNKLNDNTKIIIKEIPLGDKNPDDKPLEDYRDIRTNTAIGGTNSLYNRDMIYKNNLDDNKLGFMTTQLNTYHFFDSDIYIKRDESSEVYRVTPYFYNNYNPNGVYKLMTDISIIPISDKYGIKFDTVSDSKLMHSYVEYNETNRILPTFDEDYNRIRDYINDKKFDFRLNCLLAKPEFNGNNKLTSYDYERLLRDYTMIYNYPYNYTPMNQDDKMFLDSYSKNPICIFRTTKTEFESTEIYQKGNLLYNGDYPLDIFRNKNYEPNIDIKYSDIDYLFNNKLFKDGIFNRELLPDYLKNLGYLYEMLLLSSSNYFNMTTLINNEVNVVNVVVYEIILHYITEVAYKNIILGKNMSSGILSEKLSLVNNEVKDSNINKYYNLRAYSIYNKDNKQKLIIRNILDDPYDLGNACNTTYDSKLANEALMQMNTDNVYNMSSLRFLQDYYWDIYKKTAGPNGNNIGLFDYTQFASTDKFDTVNLLYGENIQKIIQDYKLEFTPSKENLAKIAKCANDLDKMSVKEYKEKYGLKNNHELVIDVTPTKNILDDVTATVKVTTNKNDKHTFLLKRTGVPTQEIPNYNNYFTWNEDMKYILSTPKINDITLYKNMRSIYTNGNDPYISTYHVYFNKEDIFGSIYNLYTGQLKDTDKPSSCKDLSLSYIPVKNTYLSMEQRLWELAYNDARLKMLTMRVFLDSIHEISDKEKEKYETDFWKLYTSGKFEITIKNVEYTPLPDGYKEYLYILLKDNKIGKKTMGMKNDYTNNEEYNNAVKVIYDKFIKKLKDKKIYDKHIEQVRKLLSPYAIAYEISGGDKELTNEELEKIEFLIWRNYIVDRRFYHEGNPLSGQKDPYMLDYKKLAEIIDNIKDGSENPDSPYKGLKGTFGIERDLSNSATNAWRRTGDSANFRAVPVKHGEALNTYYSDFDKYYPWSEMKRVEKDGDTLVLIPPFYYRRYQDSSIERIEISSDKKDGFELHPGSGVYVSAYLIDDNNHSTRGNKPKNNITRDQFRQAIRSRGSNFWMYDVKTDMALKMLYLVEYAENSTQKLLNTSENVYNSSDYRSGMGDDLGNKTGCLSNYIGNYRGIEGLINGALYGWEFIDGLINDYGTYYISKDSTNYSDSHSATSYSSLSYRVPSSDDYIKKHGYDTSNTWCMLPSEVGASSDTYFADYIWQYTDKPDRVAFRYWYSNSVFGLFYLIVGRSDSDSDDNLGARLIRSLK